MKTVELDVDQVPTRVFDLMHLYKEARRRLKITRATTKNYIEVLDPDFTAVVYALLIDWEDALRNCKRNEIAGMLRCECEGPDVMCEHKVIVPLKEGCKTSP